MRRLTSLLAAAAIAGAGSLLHAAPASADVAKAFSRSTAGSTVSVDHSVWDRLLKTYVVPGADGLNRVAYARFKAEAHPQLKTYISQLEKVDVPKLDSKEQFAFWANLYNAKTIDIVLDHYPVASIKDISLGGGLLATIKGGPWKAKVTSVGGHSLSLDDIEHVILRGIYKDPRVHYAVNCASVGCPNLQAEAFVGPRLDRQLDDAAKAFINSPRGARRSADGQLTASSIYSWFKDDFGGNQQGVIAHIEQYADPQLKSAISQSRSGIEFDYDWRLNDAN